MNVLKDPILKSIVEELKKSYKCHVIILYGSYAKGDATPMSDYDVAGINKGSRKIRIAKKTKGKYLDLFIFPEKDLKKITEQHLYLSKGVLLFDKSGLGNKFLKKVRKLEKSKPCPLPRDEIQARKVWASKMLERAKRKDIEGNFRRTWLTMALLEDYFLIRKKRYVGSKESFQWLKINDRTTYNLFEKILRRPTDLKQLARLIQRTVRP